MALAALASPRQSVAFEAYFTLISPALRQAARLPLLRARHNGRPCHSAAGQHWCDRCEQDVDDLLLIGFDRLRTTQAGRPPRTRTGEPVHEMQTVLRWMTGPAATESLSHLAKQLKRRPTAEEPPGLRAARAQLVYYPLRNLEAQVRREEAIARGASARPERDLRQAAWAAPLREDAVAFDLLVDAVVRLRNGSRDLYGIPADRLDRHGLDPAAARSTLRRALDLLRSVRPEFYTANIALYVYADVAGTGMTAPELSPEEVFIQGEEQAAARRELSELIAKNTPGTGDVHRYRSLLTRICAADRAKDPELLDWTAREFGIDAVTAEARVRRLVKLVSQADLDWVAERCQANRRSR